MNFRCCLKAWWWRVCVPGLLVLLLPYLFSRLASNSRRVSIHQRSGQNFLANEAPTTELRIAAYNIAHGRGLAESNYQGGDPAQRIERLQQIAVLLREVNADIVVLNEVDFDASWSDGINQARFLADQAGYDFWVEQRNLDFRILFWTWRFGNAVLSKQPIRNAKLISLSPRAAWESWLVGHKNGVACEIELNGQAIQVFAVHLEHRDESARTSAVKNLLELLKQTSKPSLLAGDLNSTPAGFPHSQSDDEGENAIHLLDRADQFHRRPQASADTAKVGDFTYRSDSPDRVIDWILIPQSWQFRDYVVHPSQLSDHRLIYADVTATTAESR